MPAVTARILILVTALVAIVVSAFWLSDIHRLLDAQTAAAHANTPAKVLATIGDFPGNSPLTPDTDARSAKAFALLRANRPAQAEALLQGVVRREPRNVRAWAGLYFADRGRKPASAAYAQARVRALAPPVRH